MSLRRQVNGDKKIYRSAFITGIGNGSHINIVALTERLLCLLLLLLSCQQSLQVICVMMVTMMTAQLILLERQCMAFLQHLHT